MVLMYHISNIFIYECIYIIIIIIFSRVIYSNWISHYFFKSEESRGVLSLSMTIMVLISILDLIPNSLNSIIDEYNLIYGLIISILVFLLGYLFISLLNNNLLIKNKSSLYKIGILNMISLMLHNFPEGIAVFISSYTNVNIGIKIFIAIILHNIPEGISIAVPLYYGGESRGKVFKKTLLSGLAEPIGALLSFIFLKNIINQLILSYILLFISGLMISISINEIYIEIKSYKIKKEFYYGISLGFFLSLLLFFI